MGNKYIGTFDIELLNETYTLRPSFDAMCEFEEKTIKWTEFDAKALAGCGMSCVEPNDTKGILAIIKAYKSSGM